MEKLKNQYPSFSFRIRALYKRIENVFNIRHQKKNKVILDN